MAKVLLLSAPYGSGHTRVASALARAFAEEGAQVDSVDHFRRFVSPAFVRGSLALFWATLRWAPWAWAAAYAASARIGPRSPAMSGMDRLGALALGRYLAETRPDVVVHVHPTPAGALAWLRASGSARVPHGIVLTDFVAHPQWVHPGLDRYFVPTDDLREGVVALGAPADRVVTSGMPIDAAFGAPADQPALRASLGLSTGVRAVLVTGGMRGALGGIERACRALAGLDRPFEAVVVCGEHAALARRLGARYGADRRFRILGRVHAMERVMGAVDLVVSKAGASTCAEAIALERPLILYRSLPGQERENEALLERAGVARRASSPRALAGHVAALLDDPAALSGMAAAARVLRRPEAARIVAKEMLGLAGGG